MKSLVIYASTSGNTGKVAAQIADSLRQHGEVELFAVDALPSTLPDSDLVVVGGPTEGHGMSKPMVQFVDRLDRRAVEGRLFAAFDTRVAWPRVLSGSAADGIARRLRKLGGKQLARPESFIVSTAPALEPGEIERAGKWAIELAGTVATLTPVAAAS